MSQFDLVAVGLILLAFADLGCTWALVKAARRFPEPALRERAVVSLILTGAAMSVAVLSVFYLARIKLPDGVGVVAMVGALALISAPQIVWFLSYETGRFR